jgi:predicted MPP superfamily phosphohydrolase
MSISWLHLTDLHMGMSEQESPLFDIKDKLFEDLKKLYDKCGPWDLVLFTGDLTQRGNKAQFELVDKFLNELNQRLGFTPTFLAVPGNHDLYRPQEKDLQDLDGDQLNEASNYNEALSFLKNWQAANLQKQSVFWKSQNSPSRQVINSIFGNYSEWWKPYKPVNNFNSGILPGEFSYTLTKDGFKVGIVGLNTPFLQLGDGNYEGKLLFDPRQFDQACDGDGPRWTGNHDACILLTHHPIEWLTPASQQALREIIASHFKVHLCGHLHEAASTLFARNGNPPHSIFQGRSLFGREIFNYYQPGDNGNEIRKTEQRLHGYNVGRIEFNGKNNNAPNLVFWPREARKQGNIWTFVPDYSFALKESISLDSVTLIQKNYKQIEEWKNLHEKIQTLVLNLILLRGHIPDESAVKGKWEECCQQIREIVDKENKSFRFESIKNEEIRNKIIAIFRQKMWDEDLLDQREKLDNICKQWGEAMGNKDEQWRNARINRFLKSLQSLDQTLNEFLKFIDKELKDSIDTFKKELSELEKKSKMSESVVL